MEYYFISSCHEVPFFNTEPVLLSKKKKKDTQHHWYKAPRPRLGAKLITLTTSIHMVGIFFLPKVWLYSLKLTCWSSNYFLLNKQYKILNSVHCKWALNRTDKWPPKSLVFFFHLKSVEMSNYTVRELYAY